ncbi:MAG: hypothetical protein LJE65_17530, partial [Desulfobacteraceae bacterium]|nr:hypothetical protein [Desulfobacteraceae bacterium]
SHPDFTLKEQLVAISRFERLIKGFATLYPDDVNTGNADWVRKQIGASHSTDDPFDSTLKPSPN